MRGLQTRQADVASRPNKTAEHSRWKRETRVIGQEDKLEDLSTFQTLACLPDDTPAIIPWSTLFDRA